MARLLIWRILTAIPLVLFISLLAFLLVHLGPGSAAGTVLGDRATPEEIAALEAQMGLDDPLPVQYMRWLSGVLTGDLGVSLRDGSSVTLAIQQRAGVTLAISLGGLLTGTLLGMPLGIAAALAPHTALDRFVTMITTLGGALPAYFLGLLLVIVFALHLDWLPAVGYTRPDHDVIDWLRTITLPTLALGLPSAAIIARHTRSAMLSVLVAPYVESARALGLPFWRIIRRHALRNALGPVWTIIGLRFAVLLGISFAVEPVFGLPGIGDLLLGAVLSQDIPVVQGVVLVLGALIIAVNVALDVAHLHLNPAAREAI